MAHEQPTVSTFDTTGTDAAGSILLDADIIPEKQLWGDLKISNRTGARMIARREGPPRLKIGRKIYYRRASVLAWLASREETPRQSPKPVPRKKARSRT